MNGKINIVIDSPIIPTNQWQPLASISEGHANLVAKDWGIQAQAVTIGTKTDPTAWLNVFIGDNYTLPSNVLGEHLTADVNGNVLAYVSARKTMSRTGAPFGYIVKGRKASLTHKATPDTYVSGSLMEVLTHEIAEALVDPNINRVALCKSTNQNWLIEVGDQAHGSRFVISYTDPKTKAVTQGICADYTLPSFYVEGSKAPWSHTGLVSAPFHLDAHCYATIYDAKTGARIPTAPYTE